jgi:hypothetical protein
MNGLTLNQRNDMNTKTYVKALLVGVALSSALAHAGVPGPRIKAKAASCNLSASARGIYEGYLVTIYESAYKVGWSLPLEVTGALSKKQGADAYAIAVVRGTPCP